METLKKPVLSAQDHEKFIRDGYVVVKDFLPPELIARAIALLEVEPPGGVQREQSDEVRAMLQECVDYRLIDAVGELFGEGGFKPAWAYDRPRPHQPDDQWHHEGAHIDMSDPCTLPESFAMGVFLALTAMPPHGGAFMYAPGSPLRLRAAATRRGYEWLWTAASQNEVIEFLAEPGDAVIFQHLMSHTGSINTSNPQTRHVLDVRYSPASALRLDGKPIEQMSTIEKACSTRYLAETFGDDFVLPQVSDDEATSAALRSGFGAASPIRAQVAFRWEGASYLAHTSEEDASTIRLARTTDWVEWADAGTIASPVGEVRTLHFDARFGPVLTVAGDDRSAVLLGSDDLSSWSTVTEVDGMRLLRQRYVIVFFCANAARGQVAFYVDPASPNQVRWRCRSTEPNFDQGIDKLADLADWPSDGVACTLADGVVIEDALVTSTRNLARFALVADLAGGPTSFVLSDVIDEFTADLRPLAFDASTPPTRIRIYERAFDVWFVTYLREGRVYWGTIDWSDDEPTLREIRGGAGLRTALSHVGLI